MSKATVYIVDDNHGVTESLSWLIESVGYQVKAYHSAKEFLAAYIDEGTACLVLDVRMPEITGPELQDILEDRGVKLPIIFITGHGDVSIAVRAMKKGALDFLSKPTNSQQLLEAINRAVRLDVERRTLEERSKDVVARYETLTAREREVAQLVVSGKLTKTIANMLHLSQRTVEMHRANIMRKMQVNTQVELTFVILQNQLFQPEEAHA